jgi:SAM-dependent methyltransferase
VHRQHFREGLLGDAYDVVICKKCGAGFADGIPERAELDRYYAEQSKYEYESNGGLESIHDFKRFELIYEQIAPLLASTDARILDIGCATGGLLSVFKRRGFKNILGVDPSPSCASAADRLHGAKVVVATIAQIAKWWKRFDLILMVGVLEHLREVSSAIHSAGNLLRAGGLLFISVPDVQGLADCRNAPFQQFSMEHVNFFSRLSLNRLMAASGFAPRNTWRSIVEWREGITEPIVSGAFRRAQTRNVEFDSLTEPALNRYIAESRKGEARILARVEELVKSREPILVWGAGAFTRHLLATTPLADASIICFVDSNPHLHGKQLAGRGIFSPEQIIDKTEPVLIGSVAFEKEIASTIRERLRLPNRLFTFGI